MRRIMLFIVSGAIASMTLAGGAIWYLRSHRTSVASIEGGRSVVVVPATSPTVSLPLSSASPQVLPLSGSSPQANVTPSNQQGTSSVSNSVAQPSDFKQFDKYASDTSQYYSEELTVGNGQAAATGDTVEVNYRGWLTTGVEFDESYNRNQTFKFTLGKGQVISGWDQGVVGMKVGGKRRLILPPTFAYGASGSNPIPPNAVLIFDIEMVAITPAASN